jgi:hypothetical protein
MTTFCVAYKNEKTTNWAEQTGNMAGGWIRIGGFLTLDEAKRLFEIRKGEFTNSAVAIFSKPDDNSVAWFERRPSYLANRHSLVANAPIPVALGGLINARESDWF